jgi:hypothetical protein
MISESDETRSFKIGEASLSVFPHSAAKLDSPESRLLRQNDHKLPFIHMQHSTTSHRTSSK